MVKYIDEFRNPNIAKSLSQKIHEIMPDSKINLMEICGGHTITIFKYGIKKLLPQNLNLISGPGCPVCVTDNSFIDSAIELSHLQNVIICSFGDMLRVPGSHSSLINEKSKQSDIRICYSPMDAIEIAKNNKNMEIIFLGIGFETTVPLIASSIISAKSEGLKNFSVLSGHKTMPNAMKALLDSEDIRLDGFICPGHVSAITGLDLYKIIAEKYKIPCVVSGFEPIDMLESIYMLVKQIKENISTVQNQYTRVVRNQGNQKAIEIMNRVFEPVDAEWRGLGIIPGSGLKIKSEFQQFDANQKFDIPLIEKKENPGCICGNIMRGINTPLDCKLFKKICTPQSPQGACMVSDEGTCATYFKYSL